MSKRPTITKMNKRHTGNQYFTHYFNFYAIEPNFSEVRIWCWETWGASTELSEWLKDAASAGISPNNKSHNLNYCWVNDQFNKRIYFGNQGAATHFALRWL